MDVFLYFHTCPLMEGVNQWEQIRLLFSLRAVALPEKLIFLAFILHRLTADYQIILFVETIIAVKNH